MGYAYLAIYSLLYTIWTPRGIVRQSSLKHCRERGRVTLVGRTRIKRGRPKETKCGSIKLPNGMECLLGGGRLLAAWVPED